jgi:hypothetical protein
MRKFLGLASTGLLLAGLAPAKAADFSEANPVVSPPPITVSSGGNTFSAQFDTEFQESNSKTASPARGDAADYYGKFTLSHTFTDNVFISGYFQPRTICIPARRICGATTPRVTSATTPS